MAKVIRWGMIGTGDVTEVKSGLVFIKRETLRFMRSQIELMKKQSIMRNDIKSKRSTRVLMI